jgi:hypothetical protein
VHALRVACLRSSQRIDIPCSGAADHTKNRCVAACGTLVPCAGSSTRNDGSGSDASPQIVRVRLLGTLAQITVVSASFMPGRALHTEIWCAPGLSGAKYSAVSHADETAALNPSTKTIAVQSGGTVASRAALPADLPTPSKYREFD